MLRYAILDELIEGKVLLVHAEKDTNITIANDEIENELNNRITFILKQNQINLAEFETLLEKEQHITLTKFKKEIRQQIRQELLKQKVQQQYVSTDKITRSDITRFYDTYKDSLPPVGKSIRLARLGINITPSREIRQKAYAKILSVKEKLADGEDFAKLAALYSEDPNASSGGDLGYITKGTLTELAFEEKVFSLKSGETSEPFESRLGFHIINVLDRKDQSVHARQIFVSITPPEQEIQKIFTRLDSIKISCKQKDDFFKAVRQSSPGGARKGLLKWQSVTDLDPVIRTAFDTLAVGAISSPVRKENSIVLYCVDTIADNRKLTLTDDWGEIAQIAQRVYAQKKLIDLVNAWREETFIDIRL
jgi:peptidyl-prolyl cis-trans isomerase SurA